jgi:multidrug efflux pump subunit AcrA (membrane-fusion protein)
MKATGILLIFLPFVSCQVKKEKTRPVISSISESVYASGSIKSKNQYQAFAPVSGIIQERLVTEGQSVRPGTPIISIISKTQKLNVENAALSASFSGLAVNRYKIEASELVIDQARDKMLNDLALLSRQKALWEQGVGTKIQLEERQLTANDSRAALKSAVFSYLDLKRQLKYYAEQSRNNLSITRELEREFIVKSRITGQVYSLYKEKGEAVSPQTPLALIGDSRQFLLELQVDEYDIVKIKQGLVAYVTMDSHKGKVFEAKVIKIYPEMNEHTKTFLVEACFTDPPAKLYPNATLEANIIIRTKKKAMLIPRSYLVDGSFIIKSNGKKIKIGTGLSDYETVEVISGLRPEDELIKPEP